jgi:hypothetical protein
MALSFNVGTGKEDADEGCTACPVLLHFSVKTIGAHHRGVLETQPSKVLLITLIREPKSTSETLEYPHLCDRIKRTSRLDHPALAVTLPVPIIRIV